MSMFLSRASGGSLAGCHLGVAWKLRHPDGSAVSATWGVSPGQRQPPHGATCSAMTSSLVPRCALASKMRRPHPLRVARRRSAPRGRRRRGSRRRHRSTLACQRACPSRRGRRRSGEPGTWRQRARSGGTRGQGFPHETPLSSASKDVPKMFPRNLSMSKRPCQCCGYWRRREGVEPSVPH